MSGPMKAALLTVVAAGVALPGVSFNALAQDAGKGEQVFHTCSPCHAIGPGAQNKVGPELNGLDGRKAGSAPNFSYSDANKNSGVVWSDGTFKQYITDPKAMIPGTKMVLAGVKNPQDRDDLWAYLKQYDADGNVKK